ncbi:putative peptidase S10, serine carboxypeptidase, alpha/Beta hydrolase [Rosa chinensis]|uniref:Putative peptidase S10, serine carboxypeptidase, alpha/Beta hydrolase n=1 Tax=Rosa chinensis TaxID=74649 RepID=A0A2P6QS88_ROSCH|nr:serine carboxypeptidase-like 13 [Rosa chinensis]PRQ37045.1 putative peptidase S10, serine carboxypeptidase, alpha/Beta hydrolase [Rosa chinensis]
MDFVHHLAPTMKMMDFLLLLMLAFTLILTSTSAASITTTNITILPGYSGDLPFALESGYIGVGDNEEVQLFYVFVESERAPADDPLLLWFNGGPGCSGLAGFFFESGPVTFKFGNYNGSLPAVLDNPFRWTKDVSMIYIDAPVGAGFSYSKTQSGYVMNDYKYVAQSYEFLQKWLEAHPAYLENVLYIGGDSFSGIIVPMIVQQILDGNENGTLPLMNLKGYVIGNPVTDSFIDANARIPYAHRLTLISDQLYRAAKTSCSGDYVNVDSSNDACISDIDAFDALINDVNTLHVLEPVCSEGTARRYLKDLSEGLLSSATTGPAYWCRSYNHMLAYNWANHQSVQDALGVRRGTKRFWQYCNSTLAYTQEVTSVISLHQSFTEVGLRALIYSGDHDMTIPHIATQKWINFLNMTLNETWRAWSVDNQTAGYTKKFVNEAFNLTFATVKGGGHIAAEYKVKECSAMIDRWMAQYPL